VISDLQHMRGFITLYGEAWSSRFRSPSRSSVCGTRSLQDLRSTGGSCGNRPRRCQESERAVLGGAAAGVLALVLVAVSCLAFPWPSI
jgi:hypothetical protein